MRGPGGRARPQWPLRLGLTRELPRAAGGDGARIDARRGGVRAGVSDKSEFNFAAERTLLPLARLRVLYFGHTSSGVPHEQPIGLTYKHAKGL